MFCIFLSFRQSQSGQQRRRDVAAAAASQRPHPDASDAPALVLAVRLVPASAPNRRAPREPCAPRTTAVPLHAGATDDAGARDAPPAEQRVRGPVLPGARRLVAGHRAAFRGWRVERGGRVERARGDAAAARHPRAGLGDTRATAQRVDGDRRHRYTGHRHGPDAAGHASGAAVHAVETAVPAAVRHQSGLHAHHVSCELRPPILRHRLLHR